MATVPTRNEQLACEGGNPVRTAPFPAWPVWGEREEELLLGVLRSGKWGTTSGGTQVAAFETEFAAYQGARFGVCVPNGTLALELALRALGVGPGDEVITTPYTFIATASSALALGAKPVFADIDPATYTLDPASVERAITPRTKVLLPVHIAGHPADLDALGEIATRHGLRLLEDACQAWGAEWRGRRVGAIGDLGTFSFQAGKNITAGEGGIVLTNDAALAELAWSLHNVGRTRDGAWYHHERLGWNFRMSEWEGAILRAQLERLPEHMVTRERNAAYLLAALAAIPGVETVAPDPRVTRHAWHFLAFRFDRAVFGGHDRDAVIAALRAEGIAPMSAGYVPLTRSPAIRRAYAEMFGADAPPAPCPVTEAVADATIWVGQNALLGTETDMDDIAAAVRKVRRAWA